MKGIFIYVNVQKSRFVQFPTGRVHFIEYLFMEFYIFCTYGWMGMKYEVLLLLCMCQSNKKRDALSVSDG
jgi:hypothetical protein